MSYITSVAHVNMNSLVLADVLFRVDREVEEFEIDILLATDPAGISRMN